MAGEQKSREMKKERAKKTEAGEQHIAKCQKPVVSQVKKESQIINPTLSIFSFNWLCNFNNPRVVFPH